MKKIITYIIILLFAVFKIANSQTVTLQTLDGNYGTTEVNVTLSGFTSSNSLNAITMYILFDPNVASFAGITYGNITSGILSNAVGNQINISWADYTANFTNGVAFKLKFNYTGGTTNLAFTSGCDFAHYGPISPFVTNVYPTFQNGAINQPTLTPSTTATIHSGVPGDYSNTTVVPVTFANFPTSSTDAEAGAVSFKVAYNTSALSFVGIDGLTGAIATATGGVITINWSNTTSVDLNNTTLNLKFNYLGGTSNLTFTGSNLISNHFGVQIPVTFANGSVTQPVTNLHIAIQPNVPAQLSGMTVLPVVFTASPAVLVGSFTMHIAYDVTALTYVPLSANGFVGNASNGIINLTYVNTSGVPISTEYFPLQFIYKGGKSDVAFTGTNQVTNTSGVVIPTTFTNGNVLQAATSADVTIGNVNFTGSNPVLVPINLSNIAGNINAATMYVNFDHTRLTYINAQDILMTGTIVNIDNGVIKINWSDPANILSNGTFLNLNFTYNGGTGNCDVPVYFTTYNSQASSLASNPGGSVNAHWYDGYVNVTPVVYNVTGSGHYCHGGTGLTVTLSNSETGFSYQLYKNASPFGSAVTGTTGSPITWNNETAGTYTVVASNGSCVSNMTGSAVITEDLLLSLTATPTQILCHGGTGSVTLLANGGFGSYTYGGDATTSLVAGTYNYTVTDGHGCSATASATINVAPTQLVLTATPTQILCHGGFGSVSLSAAGGTGAYTYGGDATTSLVAGTYNYTVSDANSCPATASATINVAPTQLVLTATPTQILCHGGFGSVSLSAAGGTGAYTYGGDATTSLVAGTYNYTVSDANSCPATASATINVAPTQLVLTATPTQILCHGGFGSVSLSAAGGTGAYTYGGDATTSLVAGTYNYTVSDANSCPATASATINVAPSALNATTTVTNILCGETTGSVLISATGGTSPYTGDGAFSGVSEGSHNYTVYDHNGCSTSVSATVLYLPVTNTNTSVSYATIQSAIDAASTGDIINVCAGDYAENVLVNKSVTLNGAGYSTKIKTATPSVPFSNILTISANNVIVSNMHLEGSPDQNGFSTTRGVYFNSNLLNAHVTNVKSSMHQYAMYADNSSNINGLTVTNCELLASGNGLEVDQHAMVSNLTITGGSISDNNYGLSSNAYLSAADNVTGLTGVNVSGTTFNGNRIKGLYFEKLNSATFDNITVTNNGTDVTPSLQAAGFDINTKAGNYSNIEIKNSTFTGNGLNNDNGGALLVKARISGGGGAYALYPATLTGVNVHNNIMSNNGGGSFGVGIRIGESNNNLMGTDVGPANVQINNNSLTGNTIFAIRNASTVSVNATCNWYGVTSASAVASKITGNLTYISWLTSGGNGAGNGFHPTGTCNGTPVTLTATPTQILCFGGTGSVTLTPTGGVGPYVYTGDAITALTAGTYNYTVTDANGSTATASATINPAPAEIPAPTVGVVDNCDGTSTLTATGFTGTLTWSNGGSDNPHTVNSAGSYTVTQTIGVCTSASSESVIASPKTAPSAPTVGVVDNCDGTSTITAADYTGSLTWSDAGTGNPRTVGAGTYSVTQTVNGCVSVVSNTVTAAPKTAPSAPTLSVLDNCNNTSTITATDYTGSLTWSDAGTGNPRTVGAGTFSVTQTINGCVSLASNTVTAAPKTAPATPTVSVSDGCGSSTLTITNAELGATFAWTPGNATTLSINVSSGGFYSLTQTVNGCTSAVGGNTANPISIPATPTIVETKHCGFSTLTAGSGTLTWDNTNQVSSINVYTTQPHSVYLTVNGCNSLPATITFSTLPGFAIPAQPTVSVQNNCGNSDLSIVSPVLGATYTWSNSATGTSINVSIANTYTVVIVDANSCSSFSPGSGTSAPKSIPSAPTVGVVDNCNNTSTLTATGVVGTLTWSNGGSDNPHSVTTGGTYTVTQTLNGCISVASAPVTAAPKTTPSAPSVSVVDNCNNTSTLTATGVTGTLTWSNSGNDNPHIVNAVGEYTVTQTVNGCTSVASTPVTATPKTPPSAPTGSANQTFYSGSNPTVASLGITAVGIVKWFDMSSGGTQYLSTASLVNGGHYFASQTINGCESTDRFEVIVTLTYKISGTLTYDNSSASPLIGFTVNLKSGNTIIATGLTDANGYYEFFTTNGSYTVESIAPSSAYWYADDNDAYAIFDYFFFGNPFPSDNPSDINLRLLAADVNQDSYIDDIDAYAIFDRFFGGVSTSDFTAPDFLFEIPTIVLNSANKPNQNILGICSGDVLGLNIP